MPDRKISVTPRTFHGCIPLLAVICASAESASAQTKKKPIQKKPVAKAVAQTPVWTANDFVILSESPSPLVSYALRRDATTFRLVIEAETLSPTDVPAVEVGVGATKNVVLANKDAKVGRRPDAVRYEFAVPITRLVTNSKDWTKLRLGVAVAWKEGALGTDRERERFRHVWGAPHNGLSTSPSDWLPLNLNEYAATVSDRKNSIALNLTQPENGKATVVIEDSKGKRIRNLIAGQTMTKGSHRIAWDGLDETGNVVQPGPYRWRAITHAGIRPEYQFSFVNAPGSNHGTFHAATNNGKYTFMSASVSEGGYDIVAFDLKGEMKAGYHTPMGMGLGRSAVAAGDKYLYVARDGDSWGQAQPDMSKPDWKGSNTLSIVRFDIDSAQMVDFAGGRVLPVNVYEWGPGSPNKQPYKELNLGGMALLGGKLYIASNAEEALLIVDAESGQKTGQIKIPAPSALCVAENNLLVISGKSIVRVSPATGEVKKLISVAGADPRGIAADAAGNIYISDGQSNNVHVFDSSGEKLREIGKAGGSYTGTYQPDRMINPRGLTVTPEGKLWISEERWTPKRYATWDAKSGKVLREYFGPTAYGAPGAGIDPLDHTRWVGQGALWKLDFATKTSRPTSLLGSAGAATHWRFVRYQGRTFLIAFAQGTTICELMPDGSVKDRAMIGSTHYYCFSQNWNPPQAFIDAYLKAYPGQTYKAGDIMGKGPGVLWVDTDGDGQMQVGEFQFSTTATDFAGAYWGQDYVDLTLRQAAVVKGKRVLLSLAPQGLLTGGAPKYPDLNATLLTSPKMERDVIGESMTDTRGNTIFNSDPNMASFAPNGKLNWTFPNKWAGVHGSQGAPLPQSGEMQGALFFLGMAPLDDKSDVFIMNGNHGRYFVLTSDGFYLDEMFKDVRLGGDKDNYWIGGENFGGAFEKSRKNGKYYLQGGGIEYRIFQVNGLDTVKRIEGSFTITGAQASAAESLLKRRIATVHQTKEAIVRSVSQPPIIDGNDNDWSGDATVKWDKSGQFPVVSRLTYDDNNLYLHYTVQDDSPWVNTGKDWQLLFKTGDSIDLQLGTDTSANPARSGPIPGDLRLLIAPSLDQNIAVLYRHRVSGTKNPVAFNSPWRGENVDVVKKLINAKIAVLREGNRYRVEASIPLNELGCKPMSEPYKADFGVIYGDLAGTVNVLRNYWSNQATGLVNDVPGEIMLSPNLWGTLRFEAKP